MATKLEGGGAWSKTGGTASLGLGLKPPLTIDQILSYFGMQFFFDIHKILPSYIDFKSKCKICHYFASNVLIFFLQITVIFIQKVPHLLQFLKIVSKNTLKNVM